MNEQAQKIKNPVGITVYQELKNLNEIQIRPIQIKKIVQNRLQLSKTQNYETDGYLQGALKIELSENIFQFAKEYPSITEGLFLEFWWSGDPVLEYIGANLIPLIVTQPTQNSLNFLRPIVTQTKNWEETDTLGFILAKIFEWNLDNWVPFIKEMVFHKNQWVRLLVPVTLGSLAKSNKNSIDKILNIMSNLLEDASLPVQYGIGWALIQLSPYNPEHVNDFIKSNKTTANRAVLELIMEEGNTLKSLNELIESTPL